MKRRDMLLMVLLVLAMHCVGSAVVEFDIDTTQHVNGNWVSNHVPSVWAQGGWADTPAPPQDWVIDRQEGTIREMAHTFDLSGPFTRYQYVGGYWVFLPGAGTAENFRQWALRGGVRPMVVLSTDNIPAPLIEGGYKAGTYGYNVRQPNDYWYWKWYLGTMIDWMIAEFGRDEVKNWSFMFGIEADWQIECVYPGTQTNMNEADNRREVMKMIDFVHAALVDCLGPNVYLGIYGAFADTVDDYIQHWAYEQNYVDWPAITYGTKIAYFGFSDWLTVDQWSKDPYDWSGYNHRVAYNWAHTVPAWAPGLQWKCWLVDDEMDAYAGYNHLKNMEISLPEQGYYDSDGGSIGGQRCAADVHYAEHHGTALYAARMTVYAGFPRLKWAWNRYALGTGDLNVYYEDDVKAPVFHATRISKMMADQRILPTAKTGSEADATNRLYAMSVASDQPDNMTRILVTNFNNDFNKNTSETAYVDVNNLPSGVTSVHLKQYMISSFQNNWWYNWKYERESNGIPYVAGNNSGHLGSNILYDPEYIGVINDIIGTLRPQDIQFWLNRVATYKAQDALTVTYETDVPVYSGTATIGLAMPSNTTMYMEVTHTAPWVATNLNLGFETSGLSGWVLDGSCVATTSESKTGPTSVKLSPTSTQFARIYRDVTGLQPNTLYTFSMWAKSSARTMDYSIWALQPSGAHFKRCYGNYSGFWNRLIVTTLSDSNGVVRIVCDVEAQDCEATDYVIFDDGTLTFISDS